MVCLSFLTVAIVASHRIRRQTFLDVPSTKEIECVMNDGSPGVCVLFYQCNKTHVLPGGFIHDSLIRSLRPNSCAADSWCCSLALVQMTEKPTTIDSGVTTVIPSTPKIAKSSVTATTPVMATTPLIAATPVITPELPKLASASCKILKSDNCPWCVTLHKVIDKTITNKEAFCMGSLIHPRIVLTAATCLLASEKFTLFARVPASADVVKNYYEKLRFYNPAYNSGTHFNDFGLIILNENVAWGSGGVQYACLAYEEMTDQCMTFGLDKNDNIVSTFIQPKEDRCKEIGGYGSLEAMCGIKTDDLTCFTSYGAPIVCLTKNTGENEGKLVGVVRSDCVNDEVLLGKLTGSTLWLQSLLPTLVSQLDHDG